VRCELADVFLHCYFDSQLSEPHAAQYERHLQDCVDCSVALVEQELLSERFQLAQLYQRAPALLVEKIRGDLRWVPSSALWSPLRRWQWLAAASAVLLIMLGVSRVTLDRHSRSYETELAAEIIIMHQRSLSQGPMTGIASSNQQVVKQWFDGRLEFAVPVHDFSDEGFVLRGGRLDYIEGRSIAALVYEGDGHLINLFVWPTEEPDKSPHPRSLGSYQWVYWRNHKLEFCLVPDGTTVELKRLYRLMAE
jgi:anti-sigma factor RsiW